MSSAKKRPTTWIELHQEASGDSVLCVAFIMVTVHGEEVVWYAEKIIYSRSDFEAMNAKNSDEWKSQVAMAARRGLGPMTRSVINSLDDAEMREAPAILEQPTQQEGHRSPDIRADLKNIIRDLVNAKKRFWRGITALGTFCLVGVYVAYGFGASAVSDDHSNKKHEVATINVIDKEHEKIRNAVSEAIKWQSASLEDLRENEPEVIQARMFLQLKPRSEIEEAFDNSVLANRRDAERLITELYQVIPNYDRPVDSWSTAALLLWSIDIAGGSSRTRKRAYEKCKSYAVSSAIPRAVREASRKLISGSGTQRIEVKAAREYLSEYPQKQIRRAFFSSKALAESKAKISIWKHYLRRNGDGQP